MPNHNSLLKNGTYLHFCKCIPPPIIHQRFMADPLIMLVQNLRLFSNCYPNWCRTNCGNFEKEIWINLDHIELFWKNVGLFQHILNFFAPLELFYTILEYFRQFWAILHHMGLNWTFFLFTILNYLEILYNLGRI